MHELALCQAIVDTVERHAGGRRVEQVDVRIGHFRQVVPDSLQFSWELLTEGTDLAGCRLVVDHVPAVIECRACGATTTLEVPILVCSSCESSDVTLVSGEELLVASIDRAREVVLMGRFHRHPDGTVHEHDHDHEHDGDHEHRDVGDHTGYVDTGAERVAVLESILDENDRVADRNRADFARAGVTTVNLMSSPGAGKTTLLKAHHHRARRAGPARDPGGRHRHQHRRRRAGRAGRPRLARQHERRLRRRVPPRRDHGPLGPRPPTPRPARPPPHRERRQPGLPGRVRRRPARQGDGLRPDRGRGEAAQVPGHVPRLRRGGRQQDRPPPAPRRRRRPVRRQRAGRQPDRRGSSTSAPAPARASRSGATGCSRCGETPEPGRASLVTSRRGRRP